MPPKPKKTEEEMKYDYQERTGRCRYCGNILIECDCDDLLDEWNALSWIQRLKELEPLLNPEHMDKEY